ncbi:MAG: lipoyl(octanoyl) transferase [Planctomycetota bacterium]
MRAGNDPLEVYLLGAVDFDAAQSLQERLVFDVSDRGDRTGVVLLCEHQPSVSIGRGGSRAHWETDEEGFASRLMPVRHVARGGGCVVHGPGHLAAYVIVPMERLGLTPGGFVDRLGDAVIETADDLRVPASWTASGDGIEGRLGRFATVGTSLRWGVTSQGLFVDVAPAMSLTRLVRPSGSGERQTSLSALRHRPLTMHAVRGRLIEHLMARLGYARHHIYTSHPLLRRTRKLVHVSGDGPDVPATGHPA